MRRGVCLLVLGVLLAALGVASARAEGSGTATTATTSAGTTTTATTTTSTTTTTGTTTTTPPPPSYGPLGATYLPSSCVGAGAAAIAEPGRPVLALGTPASSLGPAAYPQKAPIVAFGSSSGSGSTCHGSVSLQSLSLLGGAVTASSVQATAGRGSVSGLEIEGSPTALGPGQMVAIGNWAQLTLGKTVGRLTAPLVLVTLAPHGPLPAGTVVAVGFAASPQPVTKPKPKHTKKPTAAGSHAPTHHNSSSTGSSSGSGGASGSTAHKHAAKTHHASKKHKHKKPVPQPLKVTPPLGFPASHYVFPVDGGASYGDTYGANRNDIYDGWHHGDDLFAPLGTPVVAVANGTLSLVGWNQLGGWRLWLTDGAGNSYYYAHLAGYSRWTLHHPHVRAGEVVGFLGRTGDAFTTTPHLHFEIHPHQLLGLGYDGAVDPTRYLQSWRDVHVPTKEIPKPAKLKAPVGTPAQEASVVWHQLLAARHLLPKATGSPTAPTFAVRRSLPWKPHSRPEPVHAHVPALRIAAAVPTSRHVATVSAIGTWTGAGLAGGLAAAVLALSGGTFVVLRRRRPVPEIPSGESST